MVPLIGPSLWHKEAIPTQLNHFQPHIFHICRLHIHRKVYSTGRVIRADPEFRFGCEYKHQKCHGSSCHYLEDVEVTSGLTEDEYAYISSGNKVRSKFPIKAGAFSDCYIGEIITSEEANRRRRGSIINERKDLYLFDIYKFTDRDSLGETLRGGPYVIDDEFFSGPSRFFNHSCEPNMRIFARVGDYSEKNLHDLAFFATEDIRPMTELTFDYVYGTDDRQQGSERCLCGAKSCRGWLW
ncbi:Histone-lysine N-methyltransferase protein [Rutstroemia sp. NJR-2017a BBW]|nr:Histone-lysine N-methyltransferase protein [Rutstroemia sp. NJR-2017a BBW]